jgi:hypothetical protein
LALHHPEHWISILPTLELLNSLHEGMQSLAEWFKEGWMDDNHYFYKMSSAVQNNRLLANMIRLVAEMLAWRCSHPCRRAIAACPNT